jgi:DNA-binding transcriptional LysR family regulator
MFVFAKVICNSAQMLDWQDLRYELAGGRHRTFSATARRLGVNHSTVLRRIRRIERNLATRKFEKHHDGYVLIAAGEEALGLAQRIEEDSATLEAKLAMRDVRCPAASV